MILHERTPGEPNTLPRAASSLHRDAVHRMIAHRRIAARGLNKTALHKTGSQPESPTCPVICRLRAAGVSARSFARAKGDLLAPSLGHGC